MFFVFSHCPNLHGVFARADLLEGLLPRVFDESDALTCLCGRELSGLCCAAPHSCQPAPNPHLGSDWRLVVLAQVSSSLAVNMVITVPTLGMGV